MLLKTIHALLEAKFSGHDAARKYLQTLGSGIAEYGVTMTDINKVGINPTSSYNTPSGVYFYPARFYVDRLSEGRALPFVHDAKFINIIKLNAANTLNLATIQQDQIYATTKKLIAQLELIKTWYPEMDADFIMRAYELSKKKAPVDTPGGRIWYILLCVSNNTFFPRAEKANIHRWNKLLRVLGWTIVLDKDGVIHENEPVQGLALDISAFKVEKTFDNFNGKWE